MMIFTMNHRAFGAETDSCSRSRHMDAILRPMTASHRQREDRLMTRPRFVVQNFIEWDFELLSPHPVRSPYGIKEKLILKLHRRYRTREFLRRPTIRKLYQYEI